MKKDTHPKNYRLVAFKDMSNGYTFLTKSSAPSREKITMEDGKEYPLIKLEISNTSHPFYTGKPSGLPVFFVYFKKIISMNLILFDDHSRENLLPLTYTRPIAELRMGILTIREKWEWRMNSRATVMTRPYLRELFPADPGEDNLLINGSLLPTGTFAETICSLKKGESLRKDDTLLALRTGAFDVNDFDPIDYLPGAKNITEQVHLVDYPWKLFAGNGQEIESDYSLITSGRDSESLDKNIRVIHPGRVFAEPGFRGWDFTINASNG